MIAGACIIAVALIVAAIMVSNTIENVACDLAKDFFARWDAIDPDEE